MLLFADHDGQGCDDAGDLDELDQPCSIFHNMLD